MNTGRLPWKPTVSRLVTCVGWVECTEYFVRGGGGVLRKRGVWGGRHVALVSQCYLVDRQIKKSA